MTSIPAWFAKLPAPRGKKLLAIDNNVISEYFIRKRETPELKFVFEDPSLQIQCSRRVIDEALNHPSLPAVQMPNVWASLTQLQGTGKLFLSGTTQMAPAQLAEHKELIRLLQQASVRVEDAAVTADAIVKKIPLLRLDQKFKNAMTPALQNPTVRAFLKIHSLLDSATLIFVS